MSNHIKWVITRIPGQLFEINDWDGNVVLRIRGGMFPTCNDALLIETAPELLNALEAIVFQALQGSVLERDAVVTQAQTAIRKARGINS